jgi:NAD(P)-dependent dehydrogenase (short-subunit alcohol dehydrogenase family)
VSGRLAGKVCVIVGAGQQPGTTIGNGRATAVRFADEGARLVLVDRDPISLEETADDVATRSGGVRPMLLEVDITTDDGPTRIVDTALERFKRIDVLHNNVGVGAGDAPPHRLSDEVFDRILDVNLRALWRTCRAAVPAMREQGGGGVITNISSIASVAATNIAAYRMSKAGVDALTKNLAVANARHGIRVNAILPGLIDTPIGVDRTAELLGISRDELAERRARTVPLGRQGSAWDVANAAVFLASDEAGFISGILLPVDGAQSARVG